MNLGFALDVNLPPGRYVARVELANGALAHPFEPFEIRAEILHPGDCDADGQVDAVDLTCLSGVQQRDIVFEALDIPGDLDGDGEVDFDDFTTLANHFGQVPANYVEGNIDLVGAPDFEDFVILSNSFGTTRELAAVPEGNSLGVSLLAAVLWMATRRPKRCS